MINKSNDLPSFVNETNLPKIVDKLTDASNIKIANNKYGNRVQTVIDKIVEKADDVTKAIKQEIVNNSYSFKVGTGDVDVSTDVEDGFGEVGVKGVTYQNLLGTLVTVGKEWVESDNKYTLNLPSGSGQPQIRYNLAYPLKPNAKYTLICEIKEYTTGYPHFCFMTKDNTTLASTTEFTSNSVGIKTAILTTKSDVNAELLRILPRNNIDNIYSIGKNIILLEGDHTNNPNLPSYFEGIVGAGDKSKNLLNPNSFKSSTGISMIENQVINIDVPTDGGQRTIFEGLNLPTGTYRVTTKVLEGEYTGGNLIFYDSNGKKFTENRLIGSYTINATNNNINKLSIWAVKGICKIRIQLEKGSSETPYEPYYDGHKIEILSCGKNLINLKDMPTGSLGDTGKVVVSSTSNYKVTPNFIKIEPTRKVCFYYEYDENDISTPIHNMIAYYDKNFSYIGAVYDLPPKGILKTPPAQACYLRLRVRKEAIKLSLIFESSIVYEPYVSDKTQILLDEPLMRLPNGVCDEITRDGKLIRRVGKVILDGSETWSQNSGMSSAEYLVMYTTRIKNINIIRCPKISNYAIIDNYPNNNYSYECMHFEHLSGSKTATALFLRLKVTSANDFVAKIKTNPIIFYYELETPIITELPAPYLRIFKDGHLTFNTLVAPKSNHVVQLNKSAQIENAIKESQSLDNRINVLENNYDNLMLSTISRLNDLELNYALK